MGGRWLRGQHENVWCADGGGEIFLQIDAAFKSPLTLRLYARVSNTWS